MIGIEETIHLHPLSGDFFNLQSPRFSATLMADNRPLKCRRNVSGSEVKAAFCIAIEETILCNIQVERVGNT